MRHDGFIATYLIFPLCVRKNAYDLPRSFCTVFWNNIFALLAWIAIFGALVSLPAPFFAAYGYGAAIPALSGVFEAMVALGVLALIPTAIMLIAGLVMVVTIVSVATRDRYKFTRNLRTFNIDGTTPTVEVVTVNKASRFKAFVEYASNVYEKFKDKTCPIVEWD